MKKYREVLAEHPDALPVRGVFASDLKHAKDLYERNARTGTQKQLGGFTHLKAFVDGKYIDNNPAVSEGAEFFSESEILG